jgi:hypothetical protein
MIEILKIGSHTLSISWAGVVFIAVCCMFLGDR